MQRHRPWLRAGELLGGLILWAVQFTVIYMVVSVACGRGLGRATLLGLPATTAIVVATTLVALAGTAAILAVALARRRSGGLDRAGAFLTGTTILVSAVSLVAIAYNALPALLLPAC